MGSGIEGNLNITGTTTLKGNVSGDGTLHVCGAATFGSNVTVTGNVSVAGSLHICAASTFGSWINISGQLTVRDAVSMTSLIVTADGVVHGNLHVSGIATFGSTINVTGNVSMASTLHVCGATTFGSTLTVSGVSTFNNWVTMAGIQGALHMDNTLHVSGAVSMSSTLHVCGMATLELLQVCGNATFGNHIYIFGDGVFNQNAVVCGTLSISAGMASNLDFNEYKAIAMVCDNGATVPAGPTKGQWFLHTPTGRTVLMMYDGSSWVPMCNIGTTTVYVDKTDGSDAIDQGGGVDGNAYQTVQYAVDGLAGILTDSAVVSINGESYGEIVEIQGKVCTGSFKLSVKGTLTSQETNTIDSAVKGNAGTQGSIEAVGDFGGDSYGSLLVHDSLNDDYRLIHTHTNDRLTIVGTFADTPTGTYNIYGWATSIEGFFVEGQKNLCLCDITMTGQTIVQKLSAIEFDRCNLMKHRAYLYDSKVVFNQCYVERTASGPTLVYGGSCDFLRSWSNGNSTDKTGIQFLGGTHWIGNGSIIDNWDGALGAIAVTSNAYLLSYTINANGYIRVLNNDIGIYAASGGQVYGTALNQYAGNTQDEVSVTASYGYID